MSWFHCVARAMLKYGSKALAGAVPFGEVLLDVAKDVWEKYHKQSAQGSPANLAADLQAVAAAPAVGVQKSIAQAVQDVAAGQPPEVKKALTEYLAQAPYAIRRSLRRPSDASGKSVPANLSLQQARDLVPFLPTALPRFKAGDRPLPGVPLVLDELLGQGGFGEVWLAHHPRDDSLGTALKFCLDDCAAQSLRHEAKALARVRREGKHPGIVELRHIWDENEPLCLEYEYVEGGDLGGLIHELHATDPPRPETVARFMLHLLDPISFVHSLNPPIIHRDLKPANILVQRQKAGKFRLRVADFGISDVAAHEALRDTDGQSLMTVGVGGFTALYASPQQINNAPADPRDDVHALGVIWLQMLTGDLNKGRPSGSGWKGPLRSRGMSEPMLDLLEKCMDDVATVRPRDAGDLAAKLTAVVATGGSSVAHSTWISTLLEEAEGKLDREGGSSVGHATRKSTVEPAIVPCPNCEKKLEVSVGGEGKKIRCPDCKTVFLITVDGLALAEGVAAKPTTKPTKKRDAVAELLGSLADDDEVTAKPTKPTKKLQAGDDEDDPADDARPSQRKKKEGFVSKSPKLGLFVGIGIGVVILIVILIMVLGGSGSKFSKVKEGMAEKEVRDMLGRPTLDGGGIAGWYDPPLDSADLMNMDKLAKVKEAIFVEFENGKVKHKQIVSASDLKSGQPLGGSGGSEPK